MIGVRSDGSIANSSCAVRVLESSASSKRTEMSALQFFGAALSYQTP